MNSTTRERLLDLGSEIRRKQDELRRLEAEFDALTVEGNVPRAPLPLPSTTAHTPPDDTMEGSLPQRVLRWFAGHQQDTATADDLKHLMDPKSDMQTLRSTLGRLAKAGKIERLDRGEYRFKATPGMRQLFPLAQSRSAGSHA